MPEMAAELPPAEESRDGLTAMSFLEHLEELRRRLIYSILAVTVGFFACWNYHEFIFSFVQRPIMDALQRNGMAEKLVYLNPTEPFNLYLKVAALASLFVTSPFVLYLVWMLRNLRYSILVIFIIAAIITPTTDILNMCIFAAPMVALYILSIGIAWMVHPKQRKARQARKD